jgi:hypothetical protein
MSSVRATHNPFIGLEKCRLGILTDLLAAKLDYYVGPLQELPASQEE